MNRRNRAALICLLASTGLCGCGRKAPETPEPPSPKIEGDVVSFPADAPQLTSLGVEAAEPRKLAITHLTGRLYWNDDKTVRIFTPVAGQVTAIRVEIGATVAPGSPLAVIDSPDFGQALSDARSADANLAAADKAYARAKDLLEHGAAAQKDVEAAGAAYGSALAERDRSTARLKLYGGTRDQTDSLYLLRSPMAGIVVERNINPGQEVRADQMLANATNLYSPLFVVSDPTRLWLQLDAAESDLSSLSAGQRLLIHSPAFADRAFNGVVDNIGEEMDPATRTVKVRGIVDNAARLLKAEMYVTVDVVQDEARVAQAGVEIPAKAIFMLENEYYLFVERAPGQFQRRHVTVGTEKDGKVPVFAGLAAGEKAVTEGGLLLESILNPDS